MGSKKSSVQAALGPVVSAKFTGFRISRLAATLALGLAAYTSALAAQPAEWVKGRVIVQTRAGLSDAELARILKPHGGQSRRIGATNLLIVDLPPGMSETAVAKQLEHHPQLKFAELDAIFRPALVTTDPYLGSEWHVSKINASSAWDKSMGGGVTIAILDTGVDASHPDLSANMVAGWNVYDNNSNASDVLGHGTAVAGTAAAAANNALGVAGVAGSAKIMPIRISDTNGNATGSAIAQGLTFAANNGARVANISFAGLVGNSTVETAAQYMKSKGGLVVVAAGNNGVNQGLSASSTMIPVAATESTDLLATWSNFGNQVAVAAPGNNIWTTTKGGGYGQWWGTSSTDTQAPNVSVSSPVGGATVSGLVAIDVAASDNVGVARVDLRVNGTLVASDTSAPYQFSWDSAKAANGSSSLVAYAYDAAGNAKASTAVAVNVANRVVADTTPPQVVITNPGNGSWVSGTVAISVNAADNNGSSGLVQSLYIDGVKVASGTGGSLSYNWNTRKVSRGAHTVQGVAQDAAGNRATMTVQISK